MDDVDRALVLDERVAGPLERVLSRGGREVRHGLAAVFGMVARAGDDDAVPGASRLGGLVAYALSDRGVAEALRELERPSFVDPVRDRDRESGRGRRVRVLV